MVAHMECPLSSGTLCTTEIYSSAINPARITGEKIFHSNLILLFEKATVSAAANFLLYEKSRTCSST